MQTAIAHTPKAGKAKPKKFKTPPHPTNGQIGIPKRLALLSKEELSSIDSYLLAEGPIDKLIHTMQAEMPPFKGVAYEAIRQMLFRYRARFIKPKQAEIVAKLTGDKGAVQLAALSQELQRQINPLLELEKLISHQMDRINKLHAVESKAPNLLDQQTRNINLLSEMLNKFALLKMEIGEIKRLPKKMTIQHFDVSEEERQFIETARVNEATAEFLTEAMMFLKDEGIIDVQPNMVESDESVGRD
jgi:hypothetical protein